MAFAANISNCYIFVRLHNSGLQLRQLHQKGITGRSIHLHTCSDIETSRRRTIRGFTISANSLAVESSIGWTEFSKNVSGEWDGFGADFTKDGKPIELPETVVPEAYREWEVKVFDWQTQCPTLAQPKHNFDLNYKVIRLLPTVGCEADAATIHSVEERCISRATAFAYRSNGSYVAVWGCGENQMELEHCLVDPGEMKHRVRVIQALKVGDGQKSVELQKIRVFKEQWYGPFRNGEQLGGCAIRDSAFASTPALESSRVSGVWQAGPSATVSLLNRGENTPQELVDESRVRKYERDGCGLVLLPQHLWCSLDHQVHAQTCCQVGWLLHLGISITSKCSFSFDPSLSLKEITMAYETAVGQT